MTKAEFKNTVVIYKSHKLKNGFISVTFAFKNNNSVSTENIAEIYNTGGALQSLYDWKVTGKSSGQYKK